MIQKLKPDLINKLSAGEVIDGPSSIIKELVENSIDAGSSKITIEINNSGYNFIRVVDNGKGITKQDLLVCYLPYYTSKILNFEDLTTLYSLGFRGEALASIVSVADLHIKSRTDSVSIGYEIVVQDGQNLRSAVIGMNQGTIVEVTNLFERVPARKKFLKTEKVESQKILDIIISLALSHPEISFNYSLNGKTLINVTSEAVDARIKALLGYELSNKIIPISASLNHLKIYGYIGKPQIAGNKSNYQHFYVNKRLVIDKHISSAIRAAYGTLIPRDVTPFYVLFLETAPDLLDVNVHPKKLEIAFWDEAYVFEGVSKSLHEALLDSDLTYVHGEDLQSFVYDTSSEKSTYNKLKDAVTYWDISDIKSLPYEETIQIGKTYLATPIKGGVLLVDQHAAHESILYQEMYDKYLIDKNNAPSRVLPSPHVIRLNIPDSNVVEDNIGIFNTFGINIERFGSLDYRVSSVPDFIPENAITEFIEDMINNISSHGKLPDMDLKTKKTIEFLSCRSAVKAGEYLSPKERRNILEKLDQCDALYTCPHGRPIKIVVKNSELAKLFKRVK